MFCGLSPEINHDDDDDDDDDDDKLTSLTAARGKASAVRLLDGNSIVFMWVCLCGWVGKARGLVEHRQLVVV